MSEKRSPRIYLAGPEVFFDEDIRQPILESKRAVLSSLGMIGVDPLDSNLQFHKEMSSVEQGIAIYRSNIGLIKQCDGALVNLTPFRGISADVGTVFEVGYLAASGKPMIGFTMAPDDYKDRFKGTPWMGHHQGFDSAGMAVEDFGQMDNLMIESAFITSGGRVVRGRNASQVFSRGVFEEAANALAGQLKSRGLL